jgi:hypothetical protein
MVGPVSIVIMERQALVNVHSSMCRGLCWGQTMVVPEKQQEIARVTCRVRISVRPAAPEIRQPFVNLHLANPPALAVHSNLSQTCSPLHVFKLSIYAACWTVTRLGMGRTSLKLGAGQRILDDEVCAVNMYSCMCVNQPLQQSMSATNVIGRLQVLIVNHAVHASAWARAKGDNSQSHRPTGRLPCPFRGYYTVHLMKWKRLE